MKTFLYFCHFEWVSEWVSEREIYQWLNRMDQYNAGFRWREDQGYFARPLLIPHPHEKRKMEECLIDLNKGEDGEGCLKFSNILKYSVTVKAITEGLFREYSALWQHKYESPMTVSKVLYILTGGHLKFENVGLSLSSLQVNPALLICTYCWLYNISVISWQIKFLYDDIMIS